METHVDASNVPDVCKKVCRSWSWASNVVCRTKGTRILVGWDADVVDVMVLSQSDQVMHTQIVFKLDQKMLFCSFVYADNHYKNRRLSWNNLCTHHSFMKDNPWAIMGDFNSSLFLEDSLTSTSSSSIGMREFKECVNNIEVFDINTSGLHYRWTNKQKQGAVFKKIDRILGNNSFIDGFPTVAASFHPYHISDHSPCILALPSVTREKPKPFKFVNLLADKKGFTEEVKRVWETDVQGFAMYQVVQKLKALKTPLRKLFKQQGNLHEKVKVARNNLDDCQHAIDNNPLSLDLKNQHANFVKMYMEAVRDEALFLQQKSKVDWLSLGDSNMKFFHNVVKVKNHRSRIFSIWDANGNLYEGGMVPQVMVDHYTQFFGTAGIINLDPLPDLFVNVLSSQKADAMV
ncbi:uncharacterized protein LOC110942582 [Helianthus annuus]|uniref:uncharacterized protein LOC110942582 n=1 Tax=Helianthus annuus TaxID=4232 RepID=UPI000B90533F|nr:uncharacterized protein LOC110942582 [Helianthus annuus]